MGGKALKLPPIPRLKYLDMSGRLRSMMPQLRFPTALVKPEHGDLDVLYVAGEAKNDPVFIAERLFNSKAKKVNGNVTSLEWEGHQVDFIKCDAEWIDFACDWYSYGDRARVLGRTYKHYGLSLKFTGLYYGEKLISRDWDFTMMCLGFGNVWGSIDKYDLELNPYVSREIYSEYDNLRERVSWFYRAKIALIKLWWKYV